MSFSTPASSSAQSGIPLQSQPAVRLRDDANRLVAQAGVVVTATVTGPGATIANATATTDATGSAFFTGLTLTGLIGSYTLHFSATGIATLDAPALTLAAGPPSQIALTTAPSAAAQAGIALATQPQVQLRDAFGNAAAQAGTTITATVVSGTITLSGATAQTDASGLATFSGLTLSGTVGSFTLRFTASGLGSVDAPAATVLDAGPATQMALTIQPSTAATNGTALTVQPVIQLRDAFGNNATQTGVTVIASLVTGPLGGALAGDTAITSATGTATFTALRITGTAGNYSLRFASAPLASVVAATPTALAAGAATQIGLTTSTPSTAQNDVAFATQPVVQLLDQSLNPVAQAGIVVTAVISNGAGVLASGAATTDATGKATFSGLTITGATGFYQLQFSATGLGTITSPTLLLNPGVATGLGLNVQPALAAANGGVLSRQPVARLIDVSGNTVPQAGVVVTAAVTSGTPVLAGETATTTAGGIAAFAGITLTGTAGNYTFRFSAPALASIDALAPTALSAGSATQLGLATEPPAAGQSGAALAPAAVVQLRDVSGNPVAQAGVAITASLISGTGTLAGATVTTTAAGTATFSALAITGLAGSYALRFSATGLTAVDAGVSTAIGAGAATQLSITAQPAASAQSGFALGTQPVIQLRDGAGNASAQAGVVVTASVVSGTVSIGNATATTDAAGTATFSGLTLTGAAAGYTIQFNAPSLSAATAASPTVLTAGSASRLGVVTEPGVAAQSGLVIPVQPVVQIQDASFNPVAAAGLVVTASVVSGTVTLANATATTDAFGTATFSGLSIAGLVGNYTLSFTSPSLTAATAASPTVLSAGLASALTLTTEPSASGAVAAALAIQPAVQLRDGVGNPVPQSGVPVTATVVSGSVTLANATATTNGSGLATFSGLSLTATLGSYTLRFGSDRKSVV